LNIAKKSKTGVVSVNGTENNRSFVT
jgi:hypothetical protein